MYYEEETLSNLLKCEKCKQRLDTPYIISCGANLCTLCKNSIIIQLKNNEYKCDVCSTNHLYPSNGVFPISTTLQTILTLNPIQLKRTQAVDSLEKTLKLIEFKREQFKYSLKNGIDKIKEYCIDLRTDVQLNTELIIEKINQFNDQLIEQINRFEIESIKHFELKDKEKEFDQLLKQIDLFHSKWTCELKQFHISDETYMKANETGLGLIEILNDEFKRLDDFIFDGNRLIFIKTCNNNNNNNNLIKSDLIGVLQSEKISIDSIILANNNQLMRDLMKLCSFSLTQKWKLLYRASENGFGCEEFRLKCNGHNNLLVIIKSLNNNIFGGFTQTGFNPNVTGGGGYKSCPNSFLFSLINKNNEPLVMKCINTFRAIQISNQHLTVFGGCDLLVANNSNVNYDSYTNLGYYYKYLFIN